MCSTIKRSWDGASMTANSGSPPRRLYALKRRMNGSLWSHVRSCVPAERADAPSREHAPSELRPERGTATGMGNVRVLIAEDEAPIRELLAHHLDRDGFRCEYAADGPAALRLARRGIDVVVLDIGLPGIDGFEIVRALRYEGRTLPILMLTARTEEIDRVLGLESGADDYVVKPFAPREVVARVRALARRSGIDLIREPVLLQFGRLEIDEAAREVRVDGENAGLKPREFALLLELARHPGVALSRTTLLERVWGFDLRGRRADRRRAYPASSREGRGGEGAGAARADRPRVRLQVRRTVRAQRRMLNVAGPWAGVLAGVAGRAWCRCWRCAFRISERRRVAAWRTAARRARASRLRDGFIGHRGGGAAGGRRAGPHRA